MDKREYIKMLNRAQEFVNHHRQDGGLSNLYVLRVINSDGQMTDEKYGMNYMTDYGFEQFMTVLNSNGQHTQNFPKNLYVGTGANYTANMYEENQLFQGLFPNGNNLTPATVSDSTIDYAYPLYYYPIPNKNDSLITVVCKYLDCYFDESINETDVSITEYGLGSDQDHLWTHSFVYDNKGDRTSVIKHTNDKLEITVFLCLTYYESMIKGGYENNRFVAITTMERFLSYHMGENRIFTYKRNNVVANRTINDHQFSTLENRSITKTTNCQDFTLYRQTGNDQEYINGFAQYTTGFIVLEPQTLDTPEEFSINLRNYLSNMSSTSLNDRFGKSDDESVAPFTQIDLTSKPNYGVYLYDRYTGEYSNKLQITMNTSHQYSETPLQTNCGIPIYYTNMDTVMTMYLYQNINTDDPITRFNNADVSSIYATDEYWSHGSWQQITDPSHIPLELQTKRYYITSSNVNSLNPVRSTQALTITPQGRSNISCINSEIYGQKYSCDNYENGYYVIANKIFLHNSNKTYTIQSGSNNFGIDNRNHSFSYGKKIVSIDGTNGHVFITDVSDQNDISTLFRANTHSEMFSTTPGYVYSSDTGNGIICVKAQNIDEAVIINIRNGTSITRLQCKMACAINNTTYVAYITTDETPKLVIWNYDTNVKYKEYDLPEDGTDVQFMCGLGDYVWITDGQAWCYYYNLSIGTQYTACENYLGLITSSNKNQFSYIRQTCVEDVLMIYNGTDVSINNVIYVTTDDPTRFNSLSDFSGLSWNSSQIVCYLRYIHEQTINGKKVKTLMLLISGEYYQNYQNLGDGYIVIDFGKYLNLKERGIDQVSLPVAPNRYGVYLYGPYLVDGTKLIPLEYLMNFRLVGSTNTITTVNNITHISNKSWNVKITNVRPSDYGDTAIPPGNQQ